MTEAASPSHPSPEVARERLVALDVFRGLTMAAMVVVNNAGDWRQSYAPLLHAAWHGWTPTDSVFPFFLVIVGVSMTLSTKTSSWGAIARRALAIVGIGLFLNAFPAFDLVNLRWPGVLQRIGLCYAAAAVIVRLLGYGRPGRRGTALVRDIALVGVVLLVGYWAVMVLVPGATGVRGDLSLEGNVAARVDRALLAGHLYRPLYDPEGLLSTVPAVVTTLIGVIAGVWLRGEGSVGVRSARLVVAGGALLAGGLAWNPWFPINKPLWTSSYVLFTGGQALVALGALLWIIDARGWRAWTAPFVILGRNALVLYVLSSLLADVLSVVHVGSGAGAPTLRAWLYDGFFRPLASPANASLLFALAHVVVLFLPLWWLHRRRLWLRV